MPVQEIHSVVTSLMCDACNHESRGFDKPVKQVVTVMKADGWTEKMVPELTATGRRRRGVYVIRYYCKRCTKRLPE